MKKILITGGTGFIGSNSALHFAKNGWKIYLIDNLSRKGAKDNLSNLKKNIKLTFYKVDVSIFISSFKKDNIRIIVESFMQSKFIFYLHFFSKMMQCSIIEQYIYTINKTIDISLL